MEDGLAGPLGMLRDSELTGFLEAPGKLQLSGMSTKKQPWPLYSETTVVGG